MSKLEKIQNELLALSTEERELVSIFLKDSETVMESDYHQAWHTELQKRLHDQQNGAVNMMPIKSVLADLRNSITK